MAILDSVKTDLGITNTAFDTDLTVAIKAAEQKLKMQGVEVISETDELTAIAISYYCRGWKNFQGDGLRYEAAFERLADAMALSGDYKEP